MHVPDTAHALTSQCGIKLMLSQMLIHNGKLYQDVMEQQRLTQHELDAALRRQGVSSIGHVHMAMIENNGEITVQLKSESKRT